MEITLDLDSISLWVDSINLWELFNFAVWGIFFLFLIVKLFGSIRIVPTRAAFIVERLGRYSKTLGPGFHALVPVFDRVAFIHDLKEKAVDVPPQECFTKDEIQVEVDGVMYISVVDPVRASYGVTDFAMAAMELAQTTTRSIIGTLDLDRTFEERDLISSRVVEVLEQAGEAWGIRVHRYEIKNLTPPNTVHRAMEKQVTAERERRAVVARSEGEKQSRINKSEGQKLELINRSEGQMQRMINEAEGRAQEVRSIAAATAESIEKIAAAINQSGGEDSVRLQLAEKYLRRLRALAREQTRVVLPTDLSDLEGMLKSLDIDWLGKNTPAGR